MTKLFKTMLLGGTLAAFMLPAAAQSTDATQNPASPDASQGSSQQADRPPVVRDNRQQDRIAKGVADGSLTPEEASRLENKETQMGKEVKQMRAADGGKLTTADRAKLRGQQSQLSHAIGTQSNDAQKVPQNVKGEVGNRELNQQDRIAAGEANGSITGSEAKRLDSQQTRFHNEAQTLRSHDADGKLTQAQRDKLNKQENRMSHSINTAKHNNRRR